MATSTRKKSKVNKNEDGAITWFKQSDGVYNGGREESYIAFRS